MLESAQDNQNSPAAEAEGLPALATWKKIVAVVALLLGGVGVAMGGATSAGESGAGAGPGGATAMNGALAPNALQGIDGSGADGAAEEGSLWAPLLAKGGLSFFIAFCIGYALRTFLKGTMLVIGVTALAVFGLQKANIIGEIDWNQAQVYWDDLTAGLGRQFESLKSFVTGSLPSAASGGLGLVAGFRR